MINVRDILVTTTSSLDDIKVVQYLKPVSAHIVAGTNLFSDFFASFTDVFGGRSQTYQKQLISLYNEAIESIKLAAYEIGANCIIGLHIDLDEVSGKGKSMFMLTAMGTAVIIEETTVKSQLAYFPEKFENVGIDRLKSLRHKREIIKMATEGTLILEDETLDFIKSNNISEVYDFVWVELNKKYGYDESDANYRRILSYIDALPYENQLQILYGSILNEAEEKKATIAFKIIQEL